MITLHVQQVFEDVSVFKLATVLNMVRLYMQGLHRVPNMSDYGFISLEFIFYVFTFIYFFRSIKIMLKVLKTFYY